MPIKQGDFTHLAKEYTHRPGYSLTVLRAILSGRGLPEAPKVADVGAGTGKLTENLLELNLDVTAVEPNSAMREEGRLAFGSRCEWREGSGERTGLPDSTLDWVLMGSSFHWTDPAASLPEFHRILRPKGAFTAIWNPRDLEADPLQLRIDEMIREVVPELKRKSSGSATYTKGLEKTLVSNGRFNDVLFLEAPHVVEMSPERYLGVWRSVNDIRAQAGEARFAEIMTCIQDWIKGMTVVPVAYRTRAWTVIRG